jgi:hypothetical protein
VREKGSVSAPRFGYCFVASQLCSTGANRGVDFSLYVNIVNGFYTQHPDYRAVSFRTLLPCLRDGGCNSEGQLYQKVQRGRLKIRDHVE